MNDFYKRLILTRLSMDLSKKDFGALGGVSDMSQGRYEDEDPTKRRFPDVEYLLNLEKHGIDISYLLTGISSSNNLNADESLLLETFRNGNEQSQKLMLDLCRTLSGLPEQSKKKDDQDPPKSGSRHKSGDIIADGGSIGDIIQGDNNIKSTTHNYEFLSKEEIEEIEENRHQKNLKRTFKLEDAFKRYAWCENLLNLMTITSCLFGIIYLMKELGQIPATTPGEEIVSLLFSTLFPIFLGFLFYREIKSKITNVFDNLREKARRRILLEPI